MQSCCCYFSLLKERKKLADNFVLQHTRLSFILSFSVLEERHWRGWFCDVWNANECWTKARRTRKEIVCDIKKWIWQITSWWLEKNRTREVFDEQFLMGISFRIKKFQDTRHDANGKINSRKSLKGNFKNKLSTFHSHTIERWWIYLFSNKDFKEQVCQRKKSVNTTKRVISRVSIPLRIINNTFSLTRYISASRTYDIAHKFKRIWAQMKRDEWKWLDLFYSLTAAAAVADKKFFSHFTRLFVRWLIAEFWRKASKILFLKRKLLFEHFSTRQRWRWEVRFCTLIVWSMKRYLYLSDEMYVTHWQL